MHLQAALFPTHTDMGMILTLVIFYYHLSGSINLPSPGRSTVATANHETEINCLHHNDLIINNIRSTQYCISNSRQSSPSTSPSRCSNQVMRHDGGWDSSSLLLFGGKVVLIEMTMLCEILYLQKFVTYTHAIANFVSV